MSLDAHLCERRGRGPGGALFVPGSTTVKGATSRKGLGTHSLNRQPFDKDHYKRKQLLISEVQTELFILDC